MGIDRDTKKNIFDEKAEQVTLGINWGYRLREYGLASVCGWEFNNLRAETTVNQIRSCNWIEAMDDMV